MKERGFVLSVVLILAVAMFASNFESNITGQQLSVVSGTLWIDPDGASVNDWIMFFNQGGIVDLPWPLANRNVPGWTDSCNELIDSSNPTTQQKEELETACSNLGDLIDGCWALDNKVRPKPGNEDFTDWLKKATDSLKKAAKNGAGELAAEMERLTEEVKAAITNWCNEGGHSPKDLEACPCKYNCAGNDNEGKDYESKNNDWVCEDNCEDYYGIEGPENCELVCGEGCNCICLG